MKTIGYSERGVLNSLIYEITFADDSIRLLLRLLETCHFPFTQASWNADAAELLIEQSFSDFGDADAVALLKGDRPKVVFLEAKIKSSQRKTWHIDDEYAAFRDKMTTRVSSSNLFAQLYFKARLVDSLRNSGMTGLKEGVPFPA